MSDTTHEGAAPATEKALIPPYVSFLTFTNCLDWLKAMPAMPSQFNRRLWGGKFNGSTGAQLSSGLRFLGLTYDLKPLPRLEKLARAGDKERKEILREVFADAYGAELLRNLLGMTPKMLDDSLRYLGTTDSTHRKAVSFFVNAVKWMDIDVPTAIARRARIKMAGQTTAKVVAASRQADRSNRTPPGYDAQNLHFALTALLNDLEMKAQGWTRTQRDTWVTAFEATLDYAYPTRDGE